MRTIGTVILTLLTMLMQGQKQPSPPLRTPKSAIAYEISMLDKMSAVLKDAVPLEEHADQAESFVIMQIVGTVAMVQDEGVIDRTPMTLVLPHVPAHGDDPEHVAYVAWHPPQEVEVGRADFGQRETENGDPAPWRFFTLQRQELVVMNDDLDDVTANTATIPVTRGTTCDPLNPDFACVPRARDFIPAGVSVRVNPEFVAPTHPHRDVQAQMRIVRGMKLVPEVRDACDWEFRTGNNPAVGMGVVRKQPAAGLVNYIFKIKGTALQLGTRSLDDDGAQPVKLLTVQATKREPVIHVRIGNSPGVFPDPASIRATSPDHHYDAYYQLLIDENGVPVRPDLRLVPFRDENRRDCPAFHKPTITCGPGWI